MDHVGVVRFNGALRRHGSISTKDIVRYKRATLYFRNGCQVLSVVNSSASTVLTWEFNMVFSRASAILALAAVANAQVPVWGQCGGIGYGGSTACAAGASCTSYNSWYCKNMKGFDSIRKMLIAW